MDTSCPFEYISLQDAFEPPRKKKLCTEESKQALQIPKEEYSRQRNISVVCQLIDVPRTKSDIDQYPNLIDLYDQIQFYWNVDDGVLKNKKITQEEFQIMKLKVENASKKHSSSQQMSKYLGYNNDNAIKLFVNLGYIQFTLSSSKGLTEETKQLGYQGAINFRYYLGTKRFWMMRDKNAMPQGVSFGGQNNVTDLIRMIPDVDMVLSQTNAKHDKIMNPFIYLVLSEKFPKFKTLSIEK